LSLGRAERPEANGVYLFGSITVPVRYSKSYYCWVGRSFFFFLCRLLGGSFGRRVLVLYYWIFVFRGLVE